MAIQLQTKRWRTHRFDNQFPPFQTTNDQQRPAFTNDAFTNIVENPSEYSVDFSDDLRSSVTNHSVGSIGSCDSTQSSGCACHQNFITGMFRRKPLRKLAIVIVVVLVLARISTTIAWILMKDEISPTISPPIQYITPVEMIARVGDTYNDEMSNTSSEVFQSFSYAFCSNLTNSLLMNTSGVRCQVNSLSKGSIIVNCTVHLVTTEQPTKDSIMNLIQSRPIWENVEVNRTTLIISIGNSENYIDVFPDQMDKFNCSSERNGTFLPLNTTYPDNCNAFQICENDVGTLVSCGNNFQFAVMESRVCLPQHSTSTYCSKREFRNSIVTPSLGNVSTPRTPQPSTTIKYSTATMESSSPSTSKIPTNSTVTLAITTDITSRGSESTSTSMKETTDTTKLLSSSSASTTLNKTASYTTAISRMFSTYGTTESTQKVNCTNLHDLFIPRPDTYPYKCDHYYRCSHGLPNAFICPNCTYFSIEQNKECSWFNSTNTYCAQQAAEKGDDPTIFAPKCTNFESGMGNYGKD